MWPNAMVFHCAPAVLKCSRTWGLPSRFWIVEPSAKMVCRQSCVLRPIASMIRLNNEVIVIQCKVVDPRIAGTNPASLIAAQAARSHYPAVNHPKDIILHDAKILELPRVL